MISIRSFARALPRSSSHISSSLTGRTLSSLRQTSQLQKAWTAVPTTRRAAFSTALRTYQEQAGSVDSELSAKLASELQLETDAATPTEDLPAHLKEYLDGSPWQLHDKPYEEEVSLTRSFGNEKIKVTFTVADLDLSDSEPDSYSEDPALYDEQEGSMQQGGAQSKGTINAGRTKGGNFNVAPEDSVAPADREELADEEGPAAEQGFPARLHITVEKDGVQGALHVESIVRDGEVVTENVYFFPSASMTDAKSAEADYARRGLYSGPPFANLDEDLQVLIDRYVAERGIDTALAIWVPDYVDYKEQREYVGWLTRVKDFVDA